MRTPFESTNLSRMVKVCHVLAEDIRKHVSEDEVVEICRDLVRAPSGWPTPPFGAVVEDGKLYGRGSVDMKGGIAACLAAVSALQRAGFEPKGRLLMQFVADEEALGTHGARYLVENGYCDGVTEAIV